MQIRKMLSKQQQALRNRQTLAGFD